MLHSAAATDVQAPGLVSALAVGLEPVHEFSSVSVVSAVCARRRALTGLGWIVCSVPCYEYYELRTVPKKVRASRSPRNTRV